MVIGLLSFLMLFSFVATSEAELWKLAIDLNIQNEAIYPGESIIVRYGLDQDQIQQKHSLILGEYSEEKSKIFKGFQEHIRLMLLHHGMV